MAKYRIGIVGATGVVGRTLIAILQTKAWPIEELRLSASIASVGKKLTYNNQQIALQQVNKEFFTDLDILFLATPSLVSAEMLAYVDSKTYVIDNSSLLRNEEKVPLIVPGINGSLLNFQTKLIANPNCSTIQCAMGLAEIFKHYQVTSINYTTYQAVSGSGKRGMDALSENNGYYPVDIRQTCWPKIGHEEMNGYTSEEVKMIRETKKIFNMPNLLVSATCIRVPVLNAHGVLVRVETNEALSLIDVCNCFKKTKDVVLCDDLANNDLPNSLKATGTDNVYIGRIRIDLTNPNAFLCYIVADNIRIGAAYNAVAIAEKIIEQLL